MFIWQTARILREIQALMPALGDTLARLQEALVGDAYAAAIDRLWPQLEKETIDYGVMERAERVAVIPVELGWSDVGSWDAVWELREADDAGNVSVGDHLAVETRDTLVFARETERLIATVGLEGVIIVDTPDALLVTTPEHAERVREVVRRLKDEGRQDKL